MQVTEFASELPATVVFWIYLHLSDVDVFQLHQLDMFYADALSIHAISRQDIVSPLINPETYKGCSLSSNHNCSFRATYCR